MFDPPVRLTVQLRRDIEHWTRQHDSDVVMLLTGDSISIDEYKGWIGLLDQLTFHALPPLSSPEKYWNPGVL